MFDPLYLALVIDRDVAVSEEIGRALLGLPVAVLRAGDWAEGTSFYQRFLPQMVFMDSEVHGVQVPLQDLFAGDSALDVVLMSDHWNEAAALDAVARGAAASLSKPLDPSQLRQLVSGIIAQAETRRQTGELDKELLEVYQFQGRWVEVRDYWKYLQEFVVLPLCFRLR